MVFKLRVLVRFTVWAFIAVFLAVCGCTRQSLWSLANEKKPVLKVATLFTAHDVHKYLSTDNDIATAMNWCRNTGVTHVYLETYRNGFPAEKKLITVAKSRFAAEGFEVSGCVTTTGVGKISTGWKLISCYTDNSTRQQLENIFRHTASMFDEIMIDDFLFTDCECQQCQQARGQKSWSDYRCALMNSISADYILALARAVNPRVKVIIKYPLWYEQFHNHGYDVIGQTSLYDKIYIGTETRDYDGPRKDRKVQYQAYYIMRWLGGIGGAKTAGGWFDSIDTTEHTYVEQARQTVLGGAEELFLFSYGHLHDGNNPANVEKFRSELPGLFRLAALVKDKPVRGIIVPKPPGSDAQNEEYVLSFAGMLGLPLVPCAQIYPDAKAAFFSIHALKDPAFTDKLRQMLDTGRPVAVTDTLARALESQGVKFTGDNPTILPVNGDPKNLLKLTPEQLAAVRNKLLEPFGMKFYAPNNVGLYLFGSDCIVVENFNNEPVTGRLEFANRLKVKESLVLPFDAQVRLRHGSRKLEVAVPPRALVAFKITGRFG
ncbi:MAG TPA: hypothetical protein VMW23_05570 [Sedimentisphaerales bacterium]|nr:hypothetical protein [Sedimentisphaerales bacterium]